MRNIVLILSGMAVLAGCGPRRASSDTATAPAQPRKKVGYCFFKESETRGWSAKRDRDGNIIVEGKAYRSDSRYRAVLKPAIITGTSAEITPTIVQNDTGYGAQDDWWDVSATISGSAKVENVKVICGPKTFADLKVRPKP